MDGPTTSVALGNSSFTSLVLAPHNLDFIVSSDWHGPAIVLFPEILCQGRAHADSLFTGCAGKMGLSALSSGGGYRGGVLHLYFVRIWMEFRINDING